MSYNTWKKLYESLVEPVLLYASDIWGMSDFGKIKTVQNKACRDISLVLVEMQQILPLKETWAGQVVL